MQIRLPRLALAALSIVASNAFAQTSAASAPADYSNPRVWLGRDGHATVERVQLDPKAPVDCFYVYPTVSTDTTTVSDLVPDAAERNVVRLQLARFGTK